MQINVKCVVALLGTILVMSPVQAANVMRIAFEDREQFPYYLGEGESIDFLKPGISVEIIKKASEKTGIEVMFVRQPWKRCLVSLRDGQIDAIFNSSFVTDRLEYGVYPGKGHIPDPTFRITTISYSLYRKKGSTTSWDGKKFLGISGAVGVVLGYSIVDELGRTGINVEEVGSSKQNFIKLAIGRLSGAVLQTVTGDQLLRSNAFPTLERVDPPVAIKDYYLVISKTYAHDNPDLTAKLWKNIAELRDEMSSQLMQKYTN